MPNDPDADLRTAYQTAATLYMQENTVTWARFNIMLFANSIIIAAAGLTAANRLYVTALVLPVAGCLVCLLWWSMMERGFAYHDLWRDSAYALERKLPGEAIRTLRYADLLRRDRSASVEVENEPNRTHKASSSRARTYAGWAILIFAALYVFAFAQVVFLVRNCSVQAILDGANCPAPANARTGADPGR